jgi:hypothetical protein
MINFSNLIEALNDAANIANSSLVDSHSSIMETYFVKKGSDEEYSAKMVSINYPVKTDDNSIKNVAVDVPLITLVPISTSRIEELKFTTNLDIILKNNQLLVSFSNSEGSNNNLFSKKEKSSTATIEIILKPNESPEGLKNIIEGYEKILRAQIPN